MRRFTIVIIPDDARGTKQVTVPRLTLRLFSIFGILLSAGVGYLTLDYLQLCQIRSSYNEIASENEGLKGEARILMQNLGEVKRVLKRVEDYTAKLGEITASKVSTVKKETGIGPLSAEEYAVHQASLERRQTSRSTANFLPAGINFNQLTFKPVFASLAVIGSDAQKHAFDLQHLLSTLSQQKSLLAAIPSITPVNGWITSGYGSRISPFTGDQKAHLGLDIAAPVGTPILAPADGVVIFSGKKDGYGNFVMIAHGYGIVSRYGHSQQNMVQPGQRVRRGEQIATVGMTGRTTGPHLHYEVWIDGKSQNPRKFILSELQSFTSL